MLALLRIRKIGDTRERIRDAAERSVRERWTVTRARSAIRVALVLAVGAVVAAGCARPTGLRIGAASPSPRRTVPDLRGISTPRHEPPIPARGAYFGAWVRQGSFTQAHQIAALDALQHQLGRRLDIVHTYLKWRGAFPTLSDQAALAQHSMLLVSWAGARSTAVTSGRLDAVIRQVAREIKATHKPIFLEWRWEMSNLNRQGLVGTPKQFIAAWKHVRAIFVQQHVNNVAWVWCPSSKGFKRDNNASAYYPGDSEVDWICADAYPGPRSGLSFASATRPFLAWASHHRKPVMIGEFGVPHRYSSAQRVQWLRGAARTVRDDSQIKAVVYFDANAASAPSGMKIEPGTTPMQAFRAIADSPYFNPQAEGG